VGNRAFPDYRNELHQIRRGGLEHGRERSAVQAARFKMKLVQQWEDPSIARSIDNHPYID
jgi:hypothetical protein